MKNPSDEERWIVWRCLLESGILIGSIIETWTHRNAWLMLGTLRECIDALMLIIDSGISVHPDTIKVCVMQSEGLDCVPFSLGEMTHFLCENPRARNYWQTFVPDSHYPHKCPKCGFAAFIGFNLVDCKARCC